MNDVSQLDIDVLEASSHDFLMFEKGLETNPVEENHQLSILLRRWNRWAMAEADSTITIQNTEETK